MFSLYMCVVRMVCNYCTLHNTKVHAKDCGFVRAGGHSLVFRVLATQVTTPDCFSLFRFTTPNKHVFTAETGYVPTQFTMLYIVAVPRVEIKHYSVADLIVLVRSKCCIAEQLFRGRGSYVLCKLILDTSMQHI